MELLADRELRGEWGRWKERAKKPFRVVHRVVALYSLRGAHQVEVIPPVSVLLVLRPRLHGLHLQLQSVEGGVMLTDHVLGIPDSPLHFRQSVTELVHVPPDQSYFLLHLLDFCHQCSLAARDGLHEGTELLSPEGRGVRLLSLQHHVGYSRRTCVPRQRRGFWSRIPLMVRSGIPLSHAQCQPGVIKLAGIVISLRKPDK